MLRFQMDSLHPLDDDSEGSTTNGRHANLLRARHEHRNHGQLQRVSAIGMPVFVANGDGDPMILPHLSYLLAGLIPQARVKIYPDAAHGFLFQHHAEFARDVDAVLRE
jgi:pimeloyl-ACP methyl ester carboxylesterase